ncbi:uncharacterized protein LOC136088437 [Hydra vulgaris]|uniref:Uncharacterized protein LOC136088437 n=1 Tax=Hydra vulgaris TaxID=6087 RepID=A0ABM4D1T4_HYDVU
MNRSFDRKKENGAAGKKELVAASIDGDAKNFSYNSKILATSQKTEVGPEFDKEMKIDDVEDKYLISGNVQIIKCPISKIIREHDIGFLMFSQETGKAIITDVLKIEIIKQDHLKIAESHPGSTTYLSPKIQNELIHIIAYTVRANLLEKIHKEKYYGLMFDSTPDLAHREHMSELVRVKKLYLATS